MRFAIPTNEENGLDSKVNQSISKCAYFLLVDAEGNRVKKSEVIPNSLPEGLEGVTGAWAFMLSGKGVDAVIVDKIDEKDRLSVVGNGMRVFLGATGRASDALKQYSEGKLTESSEVKKGDVCSC